MKITDVRVRKIPFHRAYPIGNALSPKLNDLGMTTIVEVFTDEGITGVMASHMFDEVCRQIMANQLKAEIVG
jgi:hypothetical protein